jgi:hypothetical protein
MVSVGVDQQRILARPRQRRPDGGADRACTPDHQLFHFSTSKNLCKMLN